MSAVLTPPRSVPVAAPPAPAVVTPPPVAQLPPQPFRWTLGEYYDLDRIGFFHERRTMLLDGVIYVMPNPNPPHSTALTLVDAWSRTAFGPGNVVRVQMPFDILSDTEPNPDLAVVAGSPRDFAVANPTTARLIVEVADSSLFLDTTTKAEKYATAGVPEYWVIDLEHRLLLVFRDPVPLPQGLGATAYRTHRTLTETDSVSPLAAPGTTIRVADLLP